MTGGARPSQLTIRTIGGFDESLDPMLSEAAAGFDFIASRSRDALNWRYSDSRSGPFVIRLAEQNDRPAGYSVLRRSARRGYIIDLLTLPGDADLVRWILEDAVRHFEKQRVDLVECWLPQHHPYVRSLIEAGFVCSRDRVGLEYRLIPADRDDLRFLEDPRAQVHMTRGDSDIG